MPLQSVTLFVLPAAILAGPAANPSPANGATGVATNASLAWTAGTNATGHRLFFGTASNAVATATTNSPEFKGSLSATAYTPVPLAFSTTYYWRVDEMAGVYATTGAVWSFTTPLLAGVAAHPSPTNGATGVQVNTSLSWTAGSNATSHLLFFGATSNAVANATTNSPEFKGDLPVSSYAPPTLASSGRFFWRVDEMAGVWATAGAVWTFATVVDPNAAFPVAGAPGSNGSFTIGFPSQIGQTYRVEWTASLKPTSWSAVASNVPGTGAAIMISDPGASLQPQRFYRTVILSP